MKLWVLTLFFIVKVNTTSRIESSIKHYFQSDLVNDFQEILNSYLSMESGVALVRRDSNTNMNVKKTSLTDVITTGFYVADELFVKLLLGNLRLRYLPNLNMPLVNISLANNIIKVDKGLGRMCVDADYWAFRNRSEFKYPKLELSPFIFKQLKPVGQLGIILEGCHLLGHVVVAIKEQLVFKHSTFKLNNCQFSIEIYRTGLNKTPVVTNYFSWHQRIKLQRLLVKPIARDVSPKLQNAIFSFVNVSTMFGKDLVEFRNHQEDIFMETSIFMTNITRSFNELTQIKNRGKMFIEDFELMWTDSLFPQEGESKMRLFNLSLIGLHTAYSTQEGGPYRLPQVKLLYIVHTIRFNSLLVRGKIMFENKKNTHYHDFTVTIPDYEVTVKINAASKAPSLDELRRFMKIEVDGLRQLEISILNPRLQDEHMYIDSMIAGYLNDEIPKCILDYMSNVLPHAIWNANNAF